MTEILTSLLPLMERFQGFILDQWGVLHRGGPAEPLVVDAVVMLRRHGKRVVLLSNSGKRAEGNANRLAQWGFEPALFDAVITSGEAAHLDLRDRADPFFAGCGPACFLITRGGDSGVLTGTGCHLVETLEDADFVLLAGLDSDAVAVAEAQKALTQAVARDLPIVCANPDKVGLTPQGLSVAPGALATDAGNNGGRVRFLGKPYPEIYQHVAQALDPVLPSSCVAVGDSLEHDIAGGSGFGAATCLITTGIHADAFTNPDHPTAAEVMALFEATGIRADFVLPRFLVPSR